jgi:hypothetical protein
MLPTASCHSSVPPRLWPSMPAGGQPEMGRRRRCRPGAGSSRLGLLHRRGCAPTCASAAARRTRGESSRHGRLTVRAAIDVGRSGASSRYCETGHGSRSIASQRRRRSRRSSQTVATPGNAGHGWRRATRGRRSRSPGHPNNRSVGRRVPGQHVLAFISDADKKFVPLPKRWVVERTNAWNDRPRRLAKDQDRTVASSVCHPRLRCDPPRALAWTHPECGCVDEGGARSPG